MNLEVEFQKHAPFLRALARRLASDHVAAEDLVQETYVAASSGKPRAENGLVPWLAAILRNRAARRVRTDSRRRRREQGVGSSNLAEDTASVASKLEIGRRLLQHVEDLGADYREVVFLRYFDDLSPKQIAAKIDQPIGTVKTRLARALAKLRDRLDATDASGKRNWLPGLCALGGIEPMTGSATATLAPVVRRATMLRLAVGAVVLLATGLVVWPMWSGGAEPPLPALPAGAPAVIEIATKTDNVIKRQQQLPVGSMMTVRGMVQDATFGAASGSGRPASDVAIRCRLILPVEGSRDPRSEELEGVTDETGQFEFEVPEGATLYSIQASGSESHRSAYWSAPLDWREEAGALVLSRYPRGLLEGQVLEPSGAPVSGARVTINFRDDKDRALETSADQNGRFVFADVPEDAGRLDAEKDGFIRLAATRLSVAELGGWDPATILLAPSATIIVSVTNTAGRPVTDLPGVAVGLGMREMGLLAPLGNVGRPFLHNQKAPDGTAVMKVPAELELMMFSGSTYYEQEQEGRLIARESEATGRPIKLARGERRQLNLVMAMDCVLRGELVDASGEPVTNAYVTCDRLEDGSYNSIGVLDVDSQGRFERRFRSTEPFDIIISATIQEESGKRISVDRFVALGGRVEVSETIVLSIDNVIIGHVTDADGNAIDASIRCDVRVPKATSYSHRGTWSSDDEGEFRVPVESGSAYRLVVSAPGFREVTREVATSDDATFVLEPVQRTRVRLRLLIPSEDSADLVWPVARNRWGSATVVVGYFESNDGSVSQWPPLRVGHSWTRASATSRREQVANGAWRYDAHHDLNAEGFIEMNLERGPATIVISGRASNGAVLSRHATGPITIGAQDLELTVPFASTTSAVGQLHFSDEAPKFDAHVAVADDVGNLLSITRLAGSVEWQRVIRTSSHGRFAIFGVPVGVWELRVGTRQELERGDALWRRRVVFARGDNEPLVITL